MKRTLPIIAIALIFLIGVGILSYPLVSSVINNIEDRRHAQDELIKIENMGEKKRNALFDEAEEYNRKLISTVLLTDPFDEATYEKIEDIYRQSFNVNDEGLIGYIEIAKIDVFCRSITAHQKKCSSAAPVTSKTPPFPSAAPPPTASFRHIRRSRRARFLTICPT